MNPCRRISFFKWILELPVRILILQQSQNLEQKSFHFPVQVQKMQHDL